MPDFLFGKNGLELTAAQMQECRDRAVMNVLEAHHDEYCALVREHTEEKMAALRRALREGVCHGHSSCDHGIV